MERRVVYDARVNLLTSQGPGTAMEFALKLIDLLLGKAKAAEIAAQLVLIRGCTTIATVKKTELTC